MSRRTEDDDARDLLANLNNKAFRVCELVDGEWRPIDDKRAARVLTVALLKIGDAP